MTFEEPRFAWTSTNGIVLNVAEAGPIDGPLVILLHGFPEFCYTWRLQIGALASAGFRVLAPDQRGYSTSDKPPGVASYALDTLVDDVVGLIDASGRDRATVVGHDWGGIVAWGAIARHPSRFDRAVILNAPHPDAMLRELRGNPAQLRKSWYTLCFQLPWLPEKMIRRADFRWLVQGMERTSRPGTFSPADFERYRQAWSEPGALTAMLNWYRAAFQVKHQPFSETLIKVPTLLIWGAQDQFLGRGLARSSYALCESARLEWIEEATHWVQLEEPERVNRLIREFLDAGQSVSA